MLAPIGIDQIDYGRLWVQQGMWTGGVSCPCCDRFCKVYKRKLNSAMVAALVMVYGYYTRGGIGWLHLPTYVLPRAPKRMRAVLSREWAKLKHWGFLEDRPGKKRGAGKHDGFWRITPLGAAFVSRSIQAPKHAYVYNKRLISFDVTKFIDVIDALDDHFDYSELMAA